MLKIVRSSWRYYISNLSLPRISKLISSQRILRLKIIHLLNNLYINLLLPELTFNFLDNIFMRIAIFGAGLAAVNVQRCIQRIWLLISCSIFDGISLLMVSGLYWGIILIFTFQGVWLVNWRIDFQLVELMIRYLLVQILRIGTVGVHQIKF